MPPYPPPRIGPPRPGFPPPIMGGGPQWLLDRVPDVRQPDNYSCGAAAAMAVGKAFGVGPAGIAAWKTALGTTLKDSTDPYRIASYLGGLGLAALPRERMTVADLAAATRQRRPVIVCVQDYTDRREKGAGFSYGHYLVVLGVVLGRVVVQDSSFDNVVDPDAHAINEPGKELIRADTFEKNWHDRTRDGRPLVRFGITVGRRGVR